MCTVTLENHTFVAAWIIDQVVYTVQSLQSGKLSGYSTNGNNLIIESIMMNDDRNDTEYICGIVPSTVSQPSLANVIDEGDPTILYVGEYQCTV